MASSMRRRSASVSADIDEMKLDADRTATVFTRATMRDMRMEGPQPIENCARAPLQDVKNLLVQRAAQRIDKPRRSSSEAPTSRRALGVSMATHFYSRFKGVISNLVRPRIEETIAGDAEPQTIPPVTSASDERCDELVASNALYMHAYQCLPLNVLHSELSERKRTVYYTWLHEIWSYHTCYHPTNSFFIAVHMIDRFIMSLSPSQMKTEEKRLESVGLAALQLAVKFETQCPLAEDLVRSFKISEINHFERVLLELCDFELGRHTVIDFVRLALEVITPVNTKDRHADERHARAKLLAILSVFSPQLVAVKPSLVAAAIARLLVHIESRVWTPDMQEKLQHSAKEVYPVLEELTAYIDLAKQKNWVARDMIKYWRQNGADLLGFTDSVLCDVCRLYSEEVEQY